MSSATTIEAMKQYVDQLDKRLITDPDYLKKVYKFTFGFLLEDGQKTLPLETAIAYWDLLLTPVYGAKVGIWCDFLNESWKRAISKDTWNMFYVFLQDWDKDPELKLYDEEAAWPSLIDEFVEHVHDDSDKSKD
ncbi:Defective in cullin neddylation protein 1 [Cyberlindnera jadinii]|uniref:Defective in cullin neddylation protein n=1 Tax=Cyberlindnera jadinii (strain ATCC 18201 / CBS 1600 / BCRC 20928 / JCM 3617 / NBRC 0987 / NRRL Y-1542) TaxID=983966 RepID=A0A0H5C192_CYBJN|nr:Defective in cullin neddylation protein 1 [Cyberlindnera jadinii]